MSDGVKISQFLLLLIFLFICRGTVRQEPSAAVTLPLPLPPGFVQNHEYTTQQTTSEQLIAEPAASLPVGIA